MDGNLATSLLPRWPADAFLKALCEKIDLESYCKIMAVIKSAERDTANFEKLFNRYYNVRRSESWRREYYSIFEDALRRDAVTFEQILRELYGRTNRIESSFSSKMLATIDDSKPIWDRRVISAIKKIDPTTPAMLTCAIGRNVERAIEGYRILEDVCGELLHGSFGRDCVVCFDSLFDQYADISDMKKLDNVLWCAGD